MKTAVVMVVAVAAAAIGGGSEYVRVRKDLSAQRDSVAAAWSTLEAALDRRADLLPGMVETVRSFSKHDMPLFLQIDNDRAALLNGQTTEEKIAANDRLSGALSELLVVSENYPPLESDKKFLHLERELAAAENSIAIERRKYNELLEHYNTSIQIFPNNIVARFSGFTYNGAYLSTGPSTVGNSQF